MLSFKKVISFLGLLFISFLLCVGPSLAVSEPGGPCCVLDDCVKGANLECRGAAAGSACNLKTGSGTGLCAFQGKESISPSSSFRSLEGFINKIVNYLFMLAIVGCPLVIAIGAFLFLTSAGDPGKTRLARSMILWACIGLAVILFSKMLQSVISGIVTGS